MIEPLDKDVSRYEITCMWSPVICGVTRLNVEFADLIATCNKAKQKNMFVSGRPTDPKFIGRPKLFYCHFLVHIFIVQIYNGSQVTECIYVAIKYHNSASGLV